LHQRGKSRWALCRLGGRPGRSTVALLAKSHWALVDRWVDRPLK